MAKVTDLSAIQQAISDIIDEKCPDLVSYIGGNLLCLGGLSEQRHLLRLRARFFHPCPLSDEDATFKSVRDLVREWCIGYS